jgi:hypothetical protein
MPLKRPKAARTGARGLRDRVADGVLRVRAAVLIDREDART